jgi:hypothetical protein
MMIRTVEDNVQHVFEVVDDATGEVLYRDAVFYPKAEFEKKTDADLEADAESRFAGFRIATAPVASVDSRSIEEQKADSIASLKNTVSALVADLATVASQVDSL